MEEFHLYALTDVPMCLDYWYDKKNPSQQSLLLVGDDMGNIHLWYFLKPYEKLFETPFTNKEGVHKIWMQDLPLHQRLVHHVVIPNIHSEMVRKVQYVAETDAILSSSGSYTTSLVHLDISGKRKTYIYKLSKGIECFDYSRELNVLVTGSLDHTVRVWNPYLEDKPVAYLIGHMMAVVGVVLNVEYGHAYSYSKDGYIKVWDLRDYTCIQTLLVRFPPLSNARTPEYGPICIYLQSNRVLVACCGDYIASLRLGRVQNQNRDMPVTHNAQLCCAIYNSNFRQIATGCDDSTVTIWDLDSGAKSFSIQEAHGTEEITCMTCTTTGRKLITGARNGTIKGWNFQNGHNILQCEPTAEAEVTGLISLGKKKGILAVGWSRKITFYDDSDSDNSFVKADNDWKGGQVHMDDILSVDFCRPNLLVTASFDGEIIVWSAETETVFVRLRKGQPMQITQKLKEAMFTPGSASSAFIQRSTPFLIIPEGAGCANKNHNTRPNSRHLARHKQPEGFPQAPVDKVLFLPARVSKGLNENAILVSSEAGYLHFWSLYGRQHHKGSFYASDSVHEEESVLALSTDEDNSLLLSGDTMGHVYVWNIQDYCTNASEQSIGVRPPLLHHWKAHDLAVVSIEFIYQSFGLFVLTASTDWTARLWTLEGHYVGTFGQQQQWNLRNPDTYQHPRTPWSYIDDAKKTVETKQIFGFQSEEDEPKENDLEDDSTVNCKADEITSQTLQNFTSDETTEELLPNDTNKQNYNADTQTLPDDESITEENSVPEQDSQKSSISPYMKVIAKETHTIATEPLPRLLPATLSPPHKHHSDVETDKDRIDANECDIEGCDIATRDKSENIRREDKTAVGVKHKQPCKYGLLGVQVQQDLAKITQSRQQRRQRYGDVNAKATARFGRMCSPYQALSLLKTENVTFPSNLPMTPGMLKRGLTCTTETDLRNLTLSPLPFGEVKVEKVTKQEPLPAIGTTNLPPHPK